jgi:hypothetical protein
MQIEILIGYDLGSAANEPRGWTLLLRLERFGDRFGDGEILRLHQHVWLTSRRAAPAQASLSDARLLKTKSSMP